MDTPPWPWRIGNVEVKASLVSHRRSTLGYRLSENGTSVCYLPDHEPALGENLSTAKADWISGTALACDASLLIHDCRYTEAEYRAPRLGHSSLPDTLSFARRCEADQVLLFHHDPAHDDARLVALQAEAAGRWTALCGEEPVEMAPEGQLIDVSAASDVTPSGAESSKAE